MALRVLMVDDDADIRAVAQLALSAAGGMSVTTVASGAEAIEVAREQPPDVILLDVMMPGLDGPATLARLRDDAATASIRVVFMTAKVQREEVERYLHLGAIGVIAKPFDPMELAAEVTRILEGARR